MLLGSSARPERNFMPGACAKVLIVPEGAFLSVLCLCSFFLKKRSDVGGDYDGRKGCGLKG